MKVVFIEDRKKSKGQAPCNSGRYKHGQPLDTELNAVSQRIFIYR